MADTMALNLDQVNAVVTRMKGELNNTWKDLKTLVDDVLKDLRHSKQLIEDPSQLESDSGLEDIKPSVAGTQRPKLHSSNNHRLDPPSGYEDIRKEEIRYLCEKDGSGLTDQQPPVTLLKRTQEKLEDLAKTADTGFSSVFVSLEAVEMEAKERMQYQTENEEKIKREFGNLQEAIKRLLNKAHRGQSGQEIKMSDLTKPILVRRK